MQKQLGHKCYLQKVLRRYRKLAKKPMIQVTTRRRKEVEIQGTTAGAGRPVVRGVLEAGQIGGPGLQI
jgi:hypothetical protein